MTAARPASKSDTIRRMKQFVDVLDENRLVLAILKAARSGHATDLMVEQAIALVDRQIDLAAREGDSSIKNSATELKAGLELALKQGVKSLRETKGPTEETLTVELPLAGARIARGHVIRRQHRCSNGIVDIFDITADELIECKARGSSAALGEAAGQLKRYARSFPGSSLSIAIPQLDAEAAWLATVLRREGIAIIEVCGDASA